MMPDALLIVVTAIAEMITEICKGQPPEVKRQLWEWYVEDVKAWRALFPKPPEPKEHP